MRLIRSWMYVGTYGDTQDSALLRAHSVGAMVQLHQAVQQPDILSHFLPLADGQPIPLNLLKKALEFAREQKAGGACLLVACSAGISRSPTIATALVKEEENLSLREAFHQVRAQHPEALPDQAHWESLCRYYDEDVSFWSLWRETVGL